MTRFPIRYSRVKGSVLRVAGAPARSAYVEIADGRVRIRMGWAFRTVFDLDRVESASRGRRVRVTAGVHGWRGHWLVNGASGPIVSIRLAGHARAWVAGYPVRLREVSVSTADPDGLIAALS